MSNLEKEHKELQETFKKKLNELRAITMLQCKNGNWDYSPYMTGMANGLILALAIFEGETPNFLKEPEDGYISEDETRKEKRSKFEDTVMDLGDFRQQDFLK